MRIVSPLEKKKYIRNLRGRWNRGLPLDNEDLQELFWEAFSASPVMADLSGTADTQVPKIEPLAM